MTFTIRAELPDGAFRDLELPVYRYDARPDGYASAEQAFAAARVLAESELKRAYGDDVRFDWRGSVVFVDRAVPCDAPIVHDQLPRAFR